MNPSGHTLSPREHNVSITKPYQIGQRFLRLRVPKCRFDSGNLTSILSFSHDVFKRPLLQGCLTCFHIIPTFNDPEKKKTRFLKSLWEKEKMLVTSIFSFFPHVFKRPHLQGCLKPITRRQNFRQVQFETVFRRQF